MQDIAKLLPPDSRAFEFGSGRSTHALRRAFTTLVTLEHSADWLEKTDNFAIPPRDALELDCLKRSSLTSDFVTKRSLDNTFVVRLTRCWNKLRLIESFNLAKHADILARLKQARFILVDSPPNPAKREHALFLALRHAERGAVIMLDDLEVRATARFAQRLAGQNRKVFRFWRVNIDHQLGVFLKLRRGRLHSRPSLIEFVGTWLRA